MKKNFYILDRLAPLSDTLWNKFRTNGMHPLPHQSVKVYGLERANDFRRCKNEQKDDVDKKGKGGLREIKENL